MPSPGLVTFAQIVSRYCVPCWLLVWSIAHAKRQSASSDGPSTPLFPQLARPSDIATSSMLSWTLSCYPQVILNFRRHSTVGVNLSLPFINTLGFSAYTLSTSAMYFSPLIRAQYASRNPASPVPTVRANDVAFAGHALIMCFVTLSTFVKPIWGFEQEPPRTGWRVGKVIIAVMVGCVIGVVWMVGLVLVKGKDGGRDPNGFAWIDVVEAVGMVKLVVTVVKYIPQVLTNYRRQSTVGWSIDQILMDFFGGVLSVLQLVIDASLQPDWTGLTHNPVKLWLGGLSVFFDIVRSRPLLRFREREIGSGLTTGQIFMAQHYILYRHASVVDVEGKEENDHLRGERRYLLATDEEEATSLRGIE
ncbi:hypothetical protein MMC07_007495 [Pseudocyphellaria aurata]|nr:hypothetical protein [Pseudocyphellaria aurata]